MAKVITHPLLVRPSSVTRGLIGVVPGGRFPQYVILSSGMSNVKTRPLNVTFRTMLSHEALCLTRPPGEPGGTIITSASSRQLHGGARRWI
jgi:hypothetical protein